LQIQIFPQDLRPINSIEIEQVIILAAMMFLSVVQRNVMAFAPKFRSLSRPSVATFASRAMSDEVLQLVNSQVTVELSASQLYLSASIWCDQQELVGMAAYVSDRK
jgi:hypothetical protein